jgi:cytochrome P450
MIAALDARVRTWAVAIVDRALERGECNFVHDVAYQLPMHMIADIVGVPESDRDWLFERADTVIQSTDPQSYLTPEERSAIHVEIYNYGKDLAAEKRRVPADDVWTILTQAEIAQPDGTMTKLSEFELDQFFELLLLAGSETTRGAISSGLLALHEHPDELGRLRSDPGLMPTAVEEILRWTSPVTYFKRTATEDVELRGMQIAAGERAVYFFPSANRDEDVFDDPFRFDLARTPNPQVSFGGGGAHFCLGAHLARREISVLFDELLAHVADFEIVGEPEYSVAGIELPTTFGLKHLPVRLTPR